METVKQILCLPFQISRGPWLSKHWASSRPPGLASGGKCPEHFSKTTLRFLCLNNLPTLPSPAWFAFPLSSCGLIAGALAPAWMMKRSFLPRLGRLSLGRFDSTHVSVQNYRILSCCFSLTGDEYFKIDLFLLIYKSNFRKKWNVSFFCVLFPKFRIWKAFLLSRYPGLLREMPQHEQAEHREAAEMQPPPQSRLLQYRQSQLHSSVDPPSSLPTTSNHGGPFPSASFSHDTGRDVLNSNHLNNPVLRHTGNHLYTTGSYPHQPSAHSSSPPPSQVKCLPPEARWTQGGAPSMSPPQQNHLLGNQSHGLPYGLPMVAQQSRQEQVHLMQLQQQQQQQLNQASDEESYHTLSPRASAATALHSVDEVRVYRP